MKETQGIELENVQEVYRGPVGDLWELVMGQQIHIGGLTSSMDLADKSGVGAGMCGVDLCCCNGAGMRFLVRFRQVDRMMGVDATEKVVVRGRQRCEEEGLAGRIAFTVADVCESGLPDAEADFVWGEDAWCYVADKERLISEAVRLVKPGGLIAFTDWIEGPTELGDAEAERLLQFMKFPGVQDLGGYADMLDGLGCQVLVSENTGRFLPHVELYLNMLHSQLTYDALRIINFDTELMDTLAGEMNFLRGMAKQGKIIQGLFVARRGS